MYSMLTEYHNCYLSQAKTDGDKNLDKEIQLVLKNRGMQSSSPIRICTLFNDNDSKNFENKELEHIYKKIREKPLIVIQDKGESKSSSEDEDSEDSESEKFDVKEVIYEEARERFPKISEETLIALIINGINKAMKDIRAAVIKRVIPITLITTRVLILKDFALEPQPEKLREAAI